MLMPFRQSSLSLRQEKTLCRSIAGLLLLLWAVAHVAYLVSNCPLNLAQDEAHYWDWSRNLDWSYYSKGPGVAFLIRASCTLFGDVMWAVRLPAVLCGTLLLLSIYVLVLQVYRSDRFALLIMIMSLTFPMIAGATLLMTIDSPYACCWGWALVLGHRAIFRDSKLAWILLGLVIGMGILAKYTMILFVPSIGLFLLAHREHRPLLRKSGFWLMCVIGALCCLPILIWNMQNGWVSLKHVGGQAGVQGDKPSITWMGPLIYLGGQCVLLLIAWFFVWLAAMIAHRPWQEEDAKKRYLWWLSAPMFLVFFLFSLKNNGGQINWPITAYLSGMVLAAGWLANHLHSTSSVFYRRWLLTNVVITSMVGVTLMAFVHQPRWLRPIIEPLASTPTKSNPMPLRKLDPTCRLRGWQYFASEVDKMRVQLRHRGIEPILAGSRWNIPGELGFYCEGHPTVYCFGLAFGDRYSQYDLWHPNPIAEPEQFLGRTFIYEGGIAPIMKKAFDRFERTKVIRYEEDGQTISMWYVTICHGFKGFPEIDGNRY